MKKNHTTDTAMILIPGNFQRIAEGGEAEQFTILKFDAKSYVLNVAVYKHSGNVLYSLLWFPHFFPQLTRPGGSKNRPPPAYRLEGCMMQSELRVIRLGSKAKLIRRIIF